jgi:hypothetical protein
MKTHNAPQAITIPQDLIKIIARSFLLMLLTLYAFTLFASPKPAKLSSFTAIAEQNKVVLQWAATDEQLISHYMIQRSTNGDDYSDIACIFTGEIPSSLQLNNYQDKISSAPATFYYRLKVVQNDGSFTYSETKIVKLPS